MITLQISIPTFNRIELFKDCLDRLLDSIEYLNIDDRASIGVGIYNNSTKNIQEYSQLISSYRERFTKLSINYFSYEITGIDDAPGNLSASVLKSKAKYTWVLPDDDLASLDSIEVILNTIDKYEPSFIHGGIKNKTILKYDENNPQKNNSFKKNSVFEIIENDKVIKFLDTKGFQLQEHVYRTELLKPISSDHIYSMLDDFIPVLYGLLCCKNQRPMVFLSESIGLFRGGDPNSSWRHKWVYMSLIKWQTSVDNYLSVKLLDSKEESYARGIFMELLHRNYWRPDFLLGFYGSSGLTPFNLYRHYKSLYLKILIKSPFFFIKEVFFNRVIRKRVICKIKLFLVFKR
jgi:hypothetical protein